MRIPHIPGFDKQALNKYFKNTGMAFIGKVGSLVITMLVNIQIANYLHSELFGILNGAITYVYFFQAITSLGLDQYIVKELHQHPENRDRILGTSFRLKLFAGLLALPLIFLAYHLYPAKSTPYLFVFILSFTGVIQSFNIIDPYFQSQVQSKYIMQVQVTAYLISAFIKLMLIYVFKAPVLWFVYAFLFDWILLSAGYIITYRHNGYSISGWSFNSKLARKLVSFSWPLIISGVMVSVYMRIDQIMLQNMRNASEAGAYATVVRFSEAWYFIPSVIVSTLFPAILNARRDDIERYKRRLQNLYDLMVYISLPAAIVISFAAPLIYKLFKPEYASAAPVLAVHIWSGVFVFLGVASGQQLIAEDHARLSFIRTGFGAIVNIIFNLLLIPTMGMMGTAIATLIAYASSTLFVIFIPKVSRQGVMMFKSLFFISLLRKITKK
ncbi:polysaccharide biosynthesis protein [Mucilaginibacter sp. MD40]|uniref:flippase n=1 Tax=Mucilaginibacter sp. MD40 TaxID=2029590 RepID=UPI000BAC7A17|nr:flippase [Mucilaginibacter sp. MD40]PAW92151.1 polysaccharide biosynthesis protein [Mucilaginibacter sp. MD40]